MDCISNYVPDTDEYLSTPADYAQAELQQLRDEADFARRKASAIRKLLDGSPLDLLCVPTERLLIEWHVQSLVDEAEFTEAAIREREARKELIHESKALQSTIDLHCRGLIESNARLTEIEQELNRVEVA